MGFDRERLAERSDGAASLDSRLLRKVDAAFEGAAAEAVQALRAMPPDAGIEARFEAALLAVLRAAAAAPDLTRLCLVEAPGLGANAVRSKETGLQRFVELLDRELAAGRRRAAPPLVSEMVVGGIYEVVQRSARAGDVARLPSLADQLSQLWLPALRSQ
ncbi:MAG TPA: hypothetical protein VNO82_09585 [Solirubrobacteraceae bacterium]|nr:hypothetical protein [Solirubrobacteraceae bacterium]